MSRRPPLEERFVAAAGHPAAEAWRQVRPDPFEPATVEILKQGRKTGVYRLLDASGEGRAVVAKRCRTATGAVERLVYDELLPRTPLPALRCLGFLATPEDRYCWVFLEDAGPAAYSPDRAEHRAAAARWMGALHSARVPAWMRALLPDRGTGHYLRMLRADRATLRARRDHPLLAPEPIALLDRLAARYDAIESRWPELERDAARWPGTIVHGDFVIKNLRIRPRARRPALMVFDWEMAGWGLPASDLAQFVGRCASPDLDVYRTALERGSRRVDAADVRRLSAYGSVLRILDKISWEILGLAGDSYRDFVKPLHTLAKYEPQLVGALAALDWRDRD